jgi:hypothetical protein
MRHGDRNRWLDRDRQRNLGYGNLYLQLPGVPGGRGLPGLCLLVHERLDHDDDPPERQRHGRASLDHERWHRGSAGNLHPGLRMPGLSRQHRLRAV